MADLTTASVNDLPDSDFAYIEPGGKKVGGKTEPRSLRHFPIQDEAHVRNALARLSQSPFGEKAKAKIMAAARKFGIETAQKAMEVKAAPFTTKQFERWMAGDIPRRILVIPFGGPVPGGKAGLDVDFEEFDATSDIYGDFPQLKASRERIVDWHHDDYGVPERNQWMKGATLGHIVLDEEPSEFQGEDAIYEGVAADWWAKQGEKRMALIKALQHRGSPIFGSSQAIPWAVRKSRLEGVGSHIDVWPVIRHTISTSPQNTHAVIPSLKALLTADLPFDEVGLPALKAAMLGLDALIMEADESLSGDGQAAGVIAPEMSRALSAENERELREALEALTSVLPRLASTLRI